MNKSKRKLLLIVGPTGSGKTDLALKTTNPNIEIINGDAMQLYKEISIGNNKGKLGVSKLNELSFYNYTITPKIVNGINAWLFNLIDVNTEFNIANYQMLAKKVIEDIYSRKKTPLIVGGSGLYIYSLINNYTFQPHLNNIDRTKSLLQLQQDLTNAGFDLNKLNNSDLNNPRRLINYLAKVGSQEVENDLASESLFDLEIKLLMPSPEELRARLEKRISTMLDEGFIAEVENIISRYGLDNISQMIRNASGYKQIFEYLANRVKLTELKEKILQSHLKLVKKQNTWNKKYFLPLVKN